MNRDADNKRRPGSLALLLLATCAATANAQEEAVNLQEVEVTVVPRPTKDPQVDLDARSDFKVGEIVAYEYLVVTVKITSDNIAAEPPATLARGPAKTSGLIDDLRVRAFVDTSEVAIYAYAMADPRIVRYQAGDRFTLGHQTDIRDEGRSKVYIPLNAAIKRVTITASPDGRKGVSKGGYFNPYLLAAAACKAATDRTRFPACNGFPELVLTTP